MSRKDLLPDAGPALNLRQALYRAARDYRGGMNALALTIGIDPDDLAKRLNPTDSRPIRVELVEEIIAATRDTRLLDAVTRPAGALWFAAEPVDATTATMNALAALLEKESLFVASLAGGSADGEWTATEVGELEMHANGLIRKLMGIVAGARNALEGRCDG